MLDKAVIFFGILLGALIVFVIVNSHAYLSSTSGILMYLGVPSALISTIGIAFRIRREWRHILFLSGLSVMAAFYVAEIWLWSISAEGSLPPNADRRSQHDVVLQLRADGIEAFPAIVPRAIANTAQGGTLTSNSVPLLPLGTVARSRTVHCNESGTWRTYDSDSHGFANPPEAWNGERAEIAAIGDSFVHGACVSESKEFVALIRKRFPRTINLGAGGNGPLSELASIREYAAGRQPRVVLWFYYDNDLSNDLFAEIQHPILSRYLDPNFTQNLAIRRDGVQLELKRFAEARLHEAQRAATAEVQKSSFRLQDFLRVDSQTNPLNHVPWITLREIRKRLGLIYGGSEWRQPDVQTFRQILDLAKREVEGWGGQLLFVILPSWESVISPNRAKKIYIDSARATAESLGLPTVDLRPTFFAHPDPKSLWPNRSPGHYNDAGHALVAETVLNSLMDAGLP